MRSAEFWVTVCVFVTVGIFVAIGALAIVLVYEGKFG